jgi:hypothetical protein
VFGGLTAPADCTRERGTGFVAFEREAVSALVQRPSGVPREGEGSSREELLSREAERPEQSTFCRKGNKSRFAKRVEDAPGEVIVRVEEADESVRRWGRGREGDDIEDHMRCGGGEDGDEERMVGKSLRVARPSTKRSDEGRDVDNLGRPGWVTVLGSSFKSEGRGSSSPFSVTRTDRRGEGRGAKRI